MTESRPSIADKRRAFRQLHESGCFVIPNPWDIGSASYLQSLGFKALATTSSGFAWSRALSRRRSATRLRSAAPGTTWSRRPMCRSTPISKTAMRAMRPASLRTCDWRSTPEWLVSRSRIRPAIRPPRCTTSRSRSRGSARPGARSTRRAEIRCWWGARSASWSAGPTSARRSADCRRMHTPVPIACMRRESARASRSRPSLPRSRPSRSICWWVGPAI